MDQPRADDQRDVERRDPEQLDPPPRLVGEGLPRQPLAFRRRSLHRHGLVGQDRQRNGAEGRGDPEGDLPIDARALEDAAEQEGGGHAEGEARAEEADHLHAAHHPRVGRDEDGRDAECQAGEHSPGRKDPDAVADREDHVAHDREHAAGPDPGQDSDAPGQDGAHQTPGRRAREEEGAGEQPHLAEPDVEVLCQRADDRPDVAAVPPGDREGEDEDADAAAHD
jgi:hypothetical protein